MLKYNYCLVSMCIILLSIFTSQVKCNYSKLNPPIQRFLSRKTRALLFPQQGTLITTLVNTAGILPTIPRGLGWTFEFDNLYPLPDSVDDWKPKTTSKPIVPKAKEKIDKNYRYDEPMYSNYNNINNKNEIWQNSYHYTTKKPYFWNIYEQPKFWKTHSIPILNRPQSALNFGNPKQHILQRQRRFLIEKLQGLEKLFGFDIKFCILRSVCEIKMNYLLPPGISMIQDIVRIVLTTESISSQHSETDKVHNENDCVESFQGTCPISILEFFLHGQRIQY